MKEVPMYEHGIITTFSDGQVGYYKGTMRVIIKPLELTWLPEENITVWELALCLPFLLRHESMMPHEWDYSKAYNRHWKVVDPNTE